MAVLRDVGEVNGRRDVSLVDVQDLLVAIFYVASVVCAVSN